MKFADVQKRTEEIRDAIKQNQETLDKLKSQQKNIEDTLILQNGALQDCEYWLGQLSNEEVSNEQAQ
jgi:hypothetical protein